MAVDYTVIAGPEGPCSEGPTCPKKIRVASDPDHTYYVFTTDLDPEIATALAPHAGPGEQVGRVPNHIA